MLYLVVGGGEMSGFALISCDSQGTTDLPKLSEKCCESQGLLWNSCHMLPHIFFCAVFEIAVQSPTLALRAPRYYGHPTICGQEQLARLR